MSSLDIPTSTPPVASPNGSVSGSLRGRIASGVSWNLTGALGTQVLSIARTAVLARLLSQQDFGIAGMALTVIGALYTLTSTGIGGSIVSMKFESEEECLLYASSVWTLELVRGILITLFLAVLAVPMTHFYGEPKLLPIFLVLSLSPIFTSLNNPGMALQVRGIDFKKTTFNNLLTALSAASFTVGLAWWTQNYWALVWGNVFGSVMGMGLSFAFSSYRPRIYWNMAHARRAFNFGKHIFLIGLANYALTTMDNVLIGRLLGATALGSYVIAYSFCNLPRTLISNILSTTLFPAFAMIGREADKTRLNNLVERALMFCCAILTILIPSFIAFAPAIVRVLYGTQWVSAIAPMRLLLMAGFFFALLSLISNLAISLDRSRLESNAKFFDVVIFLLILYPLILWMGTVGAAFAGCISCAIAVIWRWFRMRHLVPQGFAHLPWLIITSISCGFLAACVGIIGTDLIFEPSFELFGGSNSLDAIFLTRSPTLLAAWFQLLFGIPLVGVLSGVLFGAFHPLARREAAQAFQKMSVRLKKAE